MPTGGYAYVLHKLTPPVPSAPYTPAPPATASRAARRPGRAPPSAAGWEDRARSRDILGQVRLARGELLEAEEVFSRSTKMRPSRPESHYYLGLVLEEQGHPGRAIESFKRSLELGDFEQAEDARSRVMKHEALAESSLPIEENKADNE